MSKLLLTTLKVIASIVGFSGTLWLVFTWTNRLDSSINEIKTSVDQNTEVLKEVNKSVDTLYRMNEETKEMVVQTGNRLIYYIKYSEQMSKDQILDAFELGVQEGKKKDLTLSEMIDGTP